MQLCASHSIHWLSFAGVIVGWLPRTYAGGAAASATPAITVARKLTREQLALYGTVNLALGGRTMPGGLCCKQKHLMPFSVKPQWTVPVQLSCWRHEDPSSTCLGRVSIAGCCLAEQRRLGNANAAPVHG